MKQIARDKDGRLYEYDTEPYWDTSSEELIITKEQFKKAME